MFAFFAWGAVLFDYSLYHDWGLNFHYFLDIDGNFDWHFDGSLDYDGLIDEDYLFYFDYFLYFHKNFSFYSYFEWLFYFYFSNDFDGFLNFYDLFYHDG